MAFNDKYNTDNVLYRSIAIGLLNFLNNKVQFEQVVADDDVRQISIPFFYAMYGNERFLQDFYLNYKANCDGPVFAEGNADPIPRGIVNMTTIAVNTGALVNKFTRGTYNKEVEGQIQAYSAYLNVIPLSLTYDVEIISNSILESYKIIQEVVATFYKAATFSVDYKGFRVPCQVGFSQDYSSERPVQFTYGDDDKITVKFTLELEAYQPVVDGKSEMFRGKTMHHGIGNELYSVSGQSGTYANLSVDVDPQITNIQNNPDEDADNSGILIPSTPPGTPPGQ